MSNIAIGEVMQKKHAPSTRKRGERTRTGKEKQLGPAAGRYVECLRELQKALYPDRFTREAVEKSVAEYLGLDTPLGHATLIGIENGTRMPGFDKLAAILDILGGDWQELMELITRQSSYEEGERLAHQRLALNAMGDHDLTKKIVAGWDRQQFERAMQLFSNDALLEMMSRIGSDPELQRMIQALIDARNSR